MVVFAVHLHQRNGTSEQTSAKMPRRTSIARASNTAAILCYEDRMQVQLETQCRPRRMLLSLFMDPPYHRFVKRLQAIKFELRHNGAQRQKQLP